MKLPDSPRREVIVLEPDQDASGLQKIGEDITEILEYKPGELFVKRFIRPKYAKVGNTGVIVSPLPSRALEKHLFGEGLLAQILIDKYVDHLPLYRQIERFKRAGVNLASSTMSDAVRSVCRLIDPLGAAHLKEVLATNTSQWMRLPLRSKTGIKKGLRTGGTFGSTTMY